MPSWFSRSSSRNEIPPVADPAPSGGGSGGYGYSNTYGDEDKARQELFAKGSNRPADAASINPPPSYRSNASVHNQSRDGDPYASSSYQQQPVQSDRYARNANVGDKYSRGYGNVDNDRAELFAGRQPTQPRRRFDDDDSGQQRQLTAEEEDEEVEGIKQDTRQLKQESVQSTRNALRIAREAEETARNTLLKLGDQSEKIANTERHLDLAKGSTNRAEDKTDELKQLNRSIFRPVIVFNKDEKRRKQEQRIADRHEQERSERENSAVDRSGGGGDDNYGEDEEGISSGRRNLPPEQQRARQAARARYQFEATASDDELEDELDDNLDEIHDVAKRLKALAVASGQELDAQNSRLNKITNKTDQLDTKIVRATDRLKRIK
ncbi:Protein transport protein sec9 [Rhizoctonia solani AG-1 IB]|uniref:Protein transport protein sec9 n=1 Tax=Thanatephorus cucumeris (strain AG1-IB / isolate 7/3/14) TaxID=1108050 RepID=M5BQ02_THACB|nr:Protein transport protein sec9 [Rhizoctonia solani AG-1 IB]